MTARWLAAAISSGALVLVPCPAVGILAGGETDAPADAPSLRVDTSNEFGFVGALSISNGAQHFIGSAVALSRDWLLTAGHNADLNDDGLPDAIWSATFNLPGSGVFGVDLAVIHPDFTGFANPFLNDDLALIHLSNSLPESLLFPTFDAWAGENTEVTLVGFGRSGYGSYGYTTQASLTTRRSGENVIDTVALDDEGSGTAEIFRYDFDSPDTVEMLGGSLGNDIETIIGSGDSGGAALVRTAAGWDVVGINTFTEGYGGLFGDTGGGILIAPYRGWIIQATGIPEPTTGALLLVSFLFALVTHSRRVRLAADGDGFGGKSSFPSPHARRLN
jgi:hypothetical protein